MLSFEFLDIQRDKGQCYGKYQDFVTGIGWFYFFGSLFLKL
jgi:hypothetical protein